MNFLATELFDLPALDTTIFFVSVVAVMGVGLLAARHERDTRDYFLAGRSVKWWAVAGSIFGSNVSSHHMVGMTGLGLSAGFATANYEFGAVAGLLVLAFLFLPIYRRLNVYTLSEFLEKRYDRRSLVVYSAVSIFVLVFIEMVATLFVGSHVLETLFGLHYRWGIVLVGFVTGLYTICGGLKAVIWTDVIQSVLLLVGGISVAYATLSHDAVGGVAGVLDANPDKFHVFFSLRDKELPWLGVMTGLMILHFNYWGMNQFIVQRALGARSNWDGRTGIITAGFFKLTIPFFTILTGMAAGKLIAANVITLPLNQEGVMNADMVFPELMKTLLPTGLVGLALAGLIGAILSTVDSMMNSAATLFTFDFYKRYVHPSASERQLIFVGRLSIGVALVIAGLLATFAYNPNGSFFQDVGNRTSFVGIGVMTAFLIGITWRGATPTAAFVVMLAGPIISWCVMLLWHLAAANSAWVVNTFSISVDGTMTGAPLLDALGRPQLNWFHRTAVAFVFATVLLVLLSKFTEEKDAASSDACVWTGSTDATLRTERAARPKWQDERLWATLLVAIDLYLCWRFA